MSKFIALHDHRAEYLVNLDHVVSINHIGDDRCRVILNVSPQFESSVVPIESYEDVRLMIAKTQGGIPTPKH